MKNVHVLPTTQPSRLAIQLDCKPKYNLQLSKIENNWTDNWKKQHIYITSDEEIEEDDLRYDLKCNEIFKTSKSDIECYDTLNCKKIILSTDPTLIADGVQEIEDEFLEWLVQNPTCEFVLPQKTQHVVSYETNYHGRATPLYKWVYKIIIPQEEPKQEKEEEYFKHLEKDKKEFAKEWEEIRQEFGFGKKESLEEAAERHYIKCIPSDRHSFIAGAKSDAARDYWFKVFKEQFKKK